jgi:hypothetical protein
MKISHAPQLRFTMFMAFCRRHAPMRDELLLLVSMSFVAWLEMIAEATIVSFIPLQQAHIV